MSILLFCALDLRGIWVPRWSIDDHDNIIATLDGRFNHVFLQVYALDQAYYPSNIVPTRRQDDTWLKNFLQEARRKNIKVSAWVNVFYSWGFAPRTNDQRHPMNFHPNWYVQDKSGKSILGLDIEELRCRGIEGYYLAPSNEQVRDHVISLIDEMLDQYDFDGVHLDYCRYPAPGFIYDVALRSKFMKTHCIDPLAFSLPGFNQRFGTWGHEDLDRRWQEFIRDDLTSFIKELNGHIKARKPYAELSVAVKADYQAASREFFQDWPTWVNSSLVDFVCLMAYQNAIESVLVRTLKVIDDPGKVAVGLGIYRLSPGRIRTQVRQVAAKPFAGVVFFSYEELRKNTAFRYLLD
jgi:uncharacterized lipoprotein YddW (UPF0748 family)